MSEKLTLIGGPCDGREIDLTDRLAQCDMLHVPQVFPAVGRFEAYPVDPVFYVHRYHIRTGIYHGGKMPSERRVGPSSWTLFGRRVERLLARLDGRRP